MCDFEAAFITVVQTHFKSVRVKCCYFHYTKNLREKAQPIVKEVEKADREASKSARLAQVTKRRLMLLPLLPEELVTPEIVVLIIDEWKTGCPNTRTRSTGSPRRS